MTTGKKTGKAILHRKSTRGIKTPMKKDNNCYQQAQKKQESNNSTDAEGQVWKK